MAAEPAAKHVPSGLDGDDWQRAISLAQDLQDPVAQKLLQWIYATESDLPIRATDLAAFVRDNPDWPRLHLIREKIEQNADSLGDSAAVSQWFTDNPPRTYEGLRAALKHLPAGGHKDLVPQVLGEFWPAGSMNKNQTASLAGAFTKTLTKAQHDQRLDNLIWAGRYTEAEAMLAFAGDDARRLGQARIALARMNSKASALVQALPAQLMEDPALIFERLRWRRRKDLDGGALEMLQKMPQNAPHPEAWWGEINILSRRAIERRDYQDAYAIAARRQVAAGSVEYAQAEWLLGWLALHLKKPEEAYQHFESLHASVGSAISLSRAAYWAARAAEALKDEEKAAEWDRKSAGYPSTFYGQISHKKVFGGPATTALQDPPIPAETQVAFEKRETVRAARILHRLKLEDFIDPFLAKLAAEAKTWEDYALTAKLARETGRYYYAVHANKEIQQKLGKFLLAEGYPVLPPLPLQKPEKALVHAIIHRESMFDPKAASPAGALGMMQLMPGTARAMARKTGEGYNKSRLTLDPRYNVALGSTYLDDMLEQYEGFYPMAIAAYNAGPGRVDEWIELFGDPRRGEMETIEWIEHIPIYETRNYIQRVLESYYMYRFKMAETPLIVTDF